MKARQRQSPCGWGEWIIARASAVGFRRQVDLAAAVGCTQNQLSRWARMAAPPGRMLKGFDRALAAALRVDQFTLFSAYASAAAASVPQASRPGDELRHEICRVLDAMDETSLRVLNTTSRALMESRACVA